MPILRKIKNDNYTIIDNKIFKNKLLSIKGKGMLCTLLSLPDNWSFSESGLAELSNDSRTAIRSALKELEEQGYLVRERKRSDDGKLKNSIYTVFEEPMLQKPMYENPTLVKKHNKEINNKEINNKYITTTVMDSKKTSLLIDYLQENGFVLTPISYEVVLQWEDTELTRYAIKQAVLNNKFNINYINKILYFYQKNNITTVQQAIEREEEFNDKRDNYYKNKYEVKESRYERERRLLQLDDEE